MKKFCMLILVFTMLGCNPVTVATDASNALGAILALAQAETPQIPAGDQAAYSSFIALGMSLQSQLNTCIGATGGKAAEVLACFNSFAQGLASPSEMAQLRIVSAGTQSRVQLYLTGVIIAANVAIKYFGGTAKTAPVISTMQPSGAELRNLAAEAHVHRETLNYHGLDSQFSH